MTDLLFPDVRIQRLAPRIIDNTGRFSSPFTQATRTISRGGDRWGFTVTFNDLAGLDRARVESLIANLRGAANRALFSPIDFPQRGSFPATELLSNNTFKNGASGWAAGSDASIAVVDRALRVTRTANSGAGVAYATATIPAVTQFIPYCWRVMVSNVRGNVNAGASGSAQFLYPGFDVGPTPALHTIAGISTASGSLGMYADNVGALVSAAGEYYDVNFTSFARCMLIDNGPNLLQQSNAFGTSPWALTNATVTTAATIAPDGTSSALFFRENTTNGSHVTAQSFTASSSAVDYSLSCYVQANTRSWVLLLLYESTGATTVQASFNVATGALGTVSIGTNWANLRTFIENCGGGWYRFTIVARKTNAATAMEARIYAESADFVNSYAGTGTNVALNLWEAVVAQSSVPTRRSPTAGSANTGIAQTGSSLNVKGAPVSTNGLLLPGDWIEVNKELKRMTAPFNSNEAGLGYLQFSPPIRTSPNDNDPVIVNTPMGRFIFSATETGWDASPAGLISGPRATYTLDLVEAA